MYAHNFTATCCNCALTRTPKQTAYLQVFCVANNEPPLCNIDSTGALSFLHDIACVSFLVFSNVLFCSPAIFVIVRPFQKAASDLASGSVHRCFWSFIDVVSAAVEGRSGSQWVGWRGTHIHKHDCTAGHTHTHTHAEIACDVTFYSAIKLLVLFF